MGEADAGRLRPAAQHGGPSLGYSHPAIPGAAGGDLLARVVDGSVDGILAFDRDCRYTLWNAAMERLTGVTRQRAVGASAFELFPFLKEIGEDRYLREALAGNAVVSTDRQYRVLESGREGWFEGHYSPLYGAGGEVVGGVGIIRDITGRVRAEEARRAAAEEKALRDSEQRYKAFIRNSSEGIWRFEMDVPVSASASEDEQLDAFFTRGYLAECNDVMARMYGYDACDEISGARLSDMMPRSDPQNDAYLRAFVRSGYRLTDAESHEVDRQGRPKVFLNNLVGVVQDGMVVGAWGTQRDVTAQKRAEGALRASETRFRKLVEQSPLSTQIFAPDGTVLAANAAWERLFGVTLAEIPGYNILHDEQLVARGVMPLIRRGFEGGAAVVPPIPYVPDRGTFKGQERWCGAVIYGVKDDGGRVEQIILIHEDITERKAAEETLRRSEERYARATKAGRVGVWELDLRTNDLYLAPNLKAMLGYSDEELQNHLDSWCALVHPDDKDRVLAATAAHLEGRTAVYEVEVRRWHKDGSYRWFLAQGTALRDAHGRPYRMVGSDTDVTDRKQFEEALRETADRLGLALSAAKMGDWSWDAATDASTFSPRGAEIFGIPPGAPITWSQVRALLHEDDQERARLAVEQAIAERGDYDIEYRVTRPSDGAQVWVAAKGRAQYDENGRVVGMHGVVQDVTERRRAEEQREQLLDSERFARGEAERASRLKDEFLATVSHELRTPLNAILGYAQLLRTGQMEEGEFAEGLEVIERNARAQAQIIEDILDMSRIVSGKLRLDVQRVDLAAVVEAAMETVRPAAEAKGIVVESALDGDAGPVGGDPGRLQQVAWNLLSNAIKFTPPGGNVAVALQRAPGPDAREVELSVTDSGQGIRPEFLPYVFDKFRQGDASTARRHAGLGLGLAIVKSLVELHGGTARALSAGEGRGATFVVTLPVSAFYATHAPHAAGGPAAAADAEPGAGPPNGGRQEAQPGKLAYVASGRPSLAGVSVLVVDDEPDGRELARRLLEECGAEVTTATSAEEAMRSLERAGTGAGTGGRGGPHVIVSDIGMPGVDGYDFIRRVRARGAANGGDTPAAALTAFARPEDRAAALAAGYQAHVAKPVEPADLVAAVATLAGRQGRV